MVFFTIFSVEAKMTSRQRAMFHLLNVADYAGFVRGTRMWPRWTGRDEVSGFAMRLVQMLPFCEERCQCEMEIGLFWRDFLHLQAIQVSIAMLDFYMMLFLTAAMPWFNRLIIDHHMLFFHWVQLYCSLTDQPEGIFTVLLFGALREDGRWPPCAVVRTHGCYSSNKIELCRWCDLKKPIFIRQQHISIIINQYNQWFFKY